MNITIDATMVNTIVTIISIIVAIVGLFAVQKTVSQKRNKKIKINQQSTGDNSTLIGIQVTKKGDETDG